jgi:hypothetical protein
VFEGWNTAVSQTDKDSSSIELTYQRELHFTRNVMKISENTVMAKCSDPNLRHAILPRNTQWNTSLGVLIYVESNIWTVDLIFHFALDSFRIVDITVVS